MLRLIAHFALGNILFWRGELVTAREHLEKAVALYDHSHHYSLASVYTVNPAVYCLSYLLWDTCAYGLLKPSLSEKPRGSPIGERVSSSPQSLRLP